MALVIHYLRLKNQYYEFLIASLFSFKLSFYQLIPESNLN